MLQVSRENEKRELGIVESGVNTRNPQVLTRYQAPAFTANVNACWLLQNNYWREPSLTSLEGVYLNMEAVAELKHRHEDTQCQHVQRIQLFSGLQQTEMKQIAAAARGLLKKRGEFVYMPGDYADSVYVLKKGRIKLSVLSESGKEIAIDLIQPGEMFGEFALIDESVRSNMTQALNEVEILVFNKRDFINLLTSQAKLALNYIRMVGDRRRRMEKKLSDITSKEVSSRICELLHELSVNASPDGEMHQSLIPLKHQDVASLIGASRQTTTSVLNDLMRCGFVELGRGWLRIKSLKDIQTYAR